MNSQDYEQDNTDEMTWIVSAEDAAVLNDIRDEGSPESAAEVHIPVKPGNHRVIALAMCAMLMLLSIAGYIYYQHLSRSMDETKRLYPSQAVIPLPANTEVNKTLKHTGKSAKAELDEVEPVASVFKHQASVMESALLVSQPEPASIRITRHAHIGQVDELLSQAYESYQAGRHDRARQLYVRILAVQPGHQDAVRGMVSIDMSTGNRYADQQRWRQAKQAYMRAYKVNSKNADIACNLAISHDRLGMLQEAMRYYRIATDLSQRQLSRCDVKQVQARMQALQAGAG